MKKKFKIFLEIIIVSLLVLYTILFFIYSTNIQYYKNREIMQKAIFSSSLNESFTQNNLIELDDLLVQLSNINYYSNEVEGNNMLDITIQFESKNNSYINVKSFDYIIFDENNNILNTSLWTNINYTKPYIRGFVNEKYQEKLFFKITDYFYFEKICTHDNITENLNKVSKTLSSALKKELTNTKQINIRIINLKYNFENSNYKSLQNTDLDFILNF